MNPAENITFTVVAVVVLLFIGLTWVIFKRRKRFALSISILLVTGLTAGYFYYPFYKEHEHARRYSEMMAYLGETYPEKNFSVNPEVYEAGVSVGRFDIAHTDTPEMGVTMQVARDGQISQTGTWTDGKPREQEELWREIRLIRGAEYGLETQLPEVKKVDQFIDGALTVFALDMNGAPAIAVFEYHQDGYSLLAFEEGAKDEFVQVESEGHLLIYVDEDFKENKINLLSGHESLNISGQKGQLIVKNE